MPCSTIPLNQGFFHFGYTLNETELRVEPPRADVLRQNGDAQPLSAGVASLLFALGKQVLAQPLALVARGYRHIADNGVVVVNLIIVVIGHMGKDGRIADNQTVVLGNEDLAAVFFDLSLQRINVLKTDVGFRLQEWLNGPFMGLKEADEAQ